MTSANANVTVNAIIDRAFENAMAGMQRSMLQTIASINGFNRSQRAANSSGGAISRTLNQISKEGRGLSASFSKAKADLAGLDAAFKKNKTTIAQLEISIKQLESANRRHGLSTKTGFNTGPLKAYKSQLESVNAMQKELTNTQRAMNFNELGKKFNKSAQTLSYAGMRMTYGLSLPISMFLRTGFQSLKALDKEVIRTGKLIADSFSTGADGIKAYNAAMAELDTRLDKLSISWGVSRELVQGLAGDFAEIGISDPKALANLAQFTAEFEKLGNVDITQAQAAIQAIYQQIARVRRDQGLAVTGTKAINQMVEEVRGAIAFFNFAENKTTLSLKDMADAFPEVSAAATSFGLNMQTTAALLAPMVGAGFQVGASANSIKVSLQRLIAPTKKNQDIIKALTRVLGKDFRLSTKVGSEGIQDLIDGYTKLQDKLGDAGALTFFAELFGVRQGPRMEVSIKQMSEYQQSLDKVGSAENKLAKDLEKQINAQLRLNSQRGRTTEGQQVELVQLNKIKDIQDVIGQSQEKDKDGAFTARALIIQKAQEAEVKRLKNITSETKGYNKEVEKGNTLFGTRFDSIQTESGKILSGAMFGTAVTKETLEAELERVQGSLQVRYGRSRESIKSIARELTIVFGDLLSAINPILEKISTWIQLLPSGTKKLIGVVLILLATLGPVLRTFGAIAQIAGSFSMMRSKGVLKFKDDMVSLNGTIAESTSLLTRLGGNFRKVGKDGNIFVSKANLKRLERAAPIQEKIDAGEKISFAEKSIYQKSIKGLVGRKEYLRVQAANTVAAKRGTQAGPLDQMVLPTGSANLSGLDASTVTATRNLQNPAKVIEQYTIDLIKGMNEAVIKATQRASKKTSSLTPRVGANSAAGGIITPFGVVKTPSTSSAGQATATTRTTGQQKPVSAQYYTKLMAILQAIQKCICSPGRVVNTGTGTRPGQPSQPNAPPAQQTTTSRPAQPTTTQPAPQPTGGGQNASSGTRTRKRPLRPAIPQVAEAVERVTSKILPSTLKNLKDLAFDVMDFKNFAAQAQRRMGGMFGSIPFVVARKAERDQEIANSAQRRKLGITASPTAVAQSKNQTKAAATTQPAPLVPAATQATSSQNQVAQQASNDIKQAETVAKETETKVSEAKKTAVSVSKKIKLTKQSFIELLTNLGLEIPSTVAQMSDFAVSIQKRTFETLKRSLSGAGAQERLNAFAGGQKTALNIRSATYLNPLFAALGHTTARQATADAKYEKEMIEGKPAEEGVPPREMTAVEGKMHARIVTGLRKKLKYYEGLQKKLDLEVQRVIQKVIASMPTASEVVIDSVIRARLAPLRERMDRVAEGVSSARRQLRIAFEQIRTPFEMVENPETGVSTKQQLTPYTTESRNKLFSILNRQKEIKPTLPMASRQYSPYASHEEELGAYPKIPTVPTGPKISPYDTDLPLATSAQFAPIAIPEDKLTETINKLVRERKIELLEQLGKIKEPEAFEELDTVAQDKAIEQKIASLNKKQRATYDRLIKSAMVAARPVAAKILVGETLKNINKIAAAIGKSEAEHTKKIATLHKLESIQRKEQGKETELLLTIEEGKATLASLAKQVTHTAADVKLKEQTIVAKDEATEAKEKLKATMSAREKQILSLKKEIKKIDEEISLGRKELTEAQAAIKVVGEAPTPKPIKPRALGGYPMPAASTRPVPQKGLEKLDTAQRRALIKQVNEFEEQIQELIAEINRLGEVKGKGYKKQIGILSKVKTKLEAEMEQAQAKALASLPKISGGAFGFDTVLQQLQATLNLPAKQFEALIAELRNRAPKAAAGLDAPISKVKGDVTKVVEAIKATVVAGNGSLESLYAAVMQQRAKLQKFGEQAAGQVTPQFGPNKGKVIPITPKETTTKVAGETREQIRARMQQVAEQVKVYGASMDSLKQYTVQELRYLAEYVAGAKTRDETGKQRQAKDYKKIIIDKLSELGVATDVAIQQVAVKPIEKATQAAAQTTPAIPQLPRAPKPTTTTPQASPPERDVPSSAIPQQPILTPASLKKLMEENAAKPPSGPVYVNAADLLRKKLLDSVSATNELKTVRDRVRNLAERASISTINPVWTNTRRAAAEAKLAAAAAGTSGLTPIAMGMSSFDQLKALIPPRPSKDKYVPPTPKVREIAGIPITGRGVARVGSAVATGGLSEIAVLLKNIIAKKIGTDAQQVRYALNPRERYEMAKARVEKERGIGPASSSRQIRKTEIEARQIAKAESLLFAPITRLSKVVGVIPSKFAMKLIPIKDNIQAIGNLYGPPILNAMETAKTTTISIGKKMIKTAYQIEKEIIKSPVTSTIIMAKGLIAAGAQIQSVMPQVVNTAKKIFIALGGLDFIQNTQAGQVFLKTVQMLQLGVGGLLVAGSNTAKFIHKAFTDPKEALNMAGRGLTAAGKVLANGAKEIALAAGRVAAVPLKAAGRAITRPVFAVTQGLFGVGGQARTVEGANGSTITKKGLFRRDVITNQDGTTSRGAGMIGKTMGGVGKAFKGAIRMGGSMASMLTYQLGPAGMLLAGPMNKVIGLMQRFSKVSAPILIIITAIALAIMVLKKTFENMGGKAQNIMDNFKAAFENIKAIFGVLVGVFKDFFASLFGSGAKDAKDGGENIRQVVGSISEKVLAFTEKFKAFFEKTLEPVIRRVLSGVSLAVKGIIGFIGPIIQFIRNLIGYFKGGGEESKKAMGKAFDGMKEAASKVFTGLITIFKTPFIFLIDIVFKVLGLITNIFERMADAVIIVIQYLLKGIINAFFAIPRAVVALVQEVVRIWTNLQKALVDLIKESVQLMIKALFTLTGGAITLVGKLVGIFGGLISGWGKILQKMAEMFAEFLRTILVDLPKKLGFGLGWFYDKIGLDSLVGMAVDILAKPADAIGNIFEKVGDSVKGIANEATSGLNSGLETAEEKAIAVTEGIGNGVKAVLGSIRDITEMGDDVLKNIQDKILGGVDSVANSTMDAIGSASDWVVGIGRGIKDWISGLKTAETIGKGIGKDVGGKDKKPDAQTPSQATARGITIAEAIDEGAKALKANFFDKVINSLSEAIGKFKDKFREGLEKQKQDVLKFFDDQVAAIDALAEAEERLTATKEYEENRRLKIAERALQRDGYIKQRALAIYEGRIDDARLLGLQEEKDNKEFNKDLSKMDEDRNKTLQSQNREQAKKVIQQQKEQLSEKFDKDIKSFEDFVESIGKNGTLTKEELTKQFKALQDEATKTSDAMKGSFQTYYSALPGLIQQNTDPTVGSFNMSLDTLIQAATTKYGTDVNSKDPASLLGITGLMLSGTSQAYTDGFNNSIIPAYSAGIAEITKIGTDFADPNNPNSPEKVYAKAINDATEAIKAEFYKMKTEAGSAFAEVIKSLNEEVKNLAVAEAIRSATEQLDEEQVKAERRAAAEKAEAGGAGEKSSAMGISRKMFLTEAGKDKVFKLGDTDPIISAAKAKLIEYQMLSADSNLSQKFDQPMKKAVLAFQKKYLAKEVKDPQGNLGAVTAKALGLFGSAGVQKKYYGGSIKKSMAIGGSVPGFSQQGVPALLHGGEYVINAKAVSGLGQMFLDYVNGFKFGIPRYKAPNIGMPQIGNQFKTEIIKTENETIHNYNFYVDNFIGEDQWFDSMMKNYNVKVLPNRQKAAGLESRVVRTYNGINRGM